MAKMLKNTDFDLTNIGTKFELDEVMPKFRTEKRTDEKGNTILGTDNRPRQFNTAEIIGWKYSVTIMDGQFKKKSTQITVSNPKQVVTNDDIMKADDFPVNFENLEVAMSGNPMYYKADNIILLKGGLTHGK